MFWNEISLEMIWTPHQALSFTSFQCLSSQGSFAYCLNAYCHLYASSFCNAEAAFFGNTIFFYFCKGLSMSGPQ